MNRCLLLNHVTNSLTNHNGLVDFSWQFKDISELRSFYRFAQDLRVLSSAKYPIFFFSASTIIVSLQWRIISPAVDILSLNTLQLKVTM